MMRILLITLLIGYSTFAQEAIIPDNIHKIKMDSMAKISGRLISMNKDSSETIANQMLKYSEKHNFLRGQAQSLATLGAICNSRNDKGKALFYYKKSLTIFKELENDILTNRIRTLIGSLFRQAKEYDEALMYTKKVQEYLLKNNDLRGLATIYHNIALIHENTNKNFEVVLFNLKKAEEISRAFIKDTSNATTQINMNIRELSGILNSQSEVYIKRDKDLAFAIDRANESLKKMKDHNPNNHYFLGKSYLLLGKAYYKKKKFKKALVYNDSSLVSYSAINYSAGLKEAYVSRKNILAYTGNYKQALEVSDLVASYRDSLNQTDKEKEFSRMKAEYETDRIAAEKDAAEARATLAETTVLQNRNYLIGTVVITILIALSSLFYFRKLKTAKQVELVSTELKQTQKRLILEKKYKESELKALKSQMNPHFIFNTLNSIQEYIVTNKKNEASEYLGRFADLIRRYLRHSEMGSISITDEVESLQIYIDLEALRFEKEFNYSVTLAQTLSNVTLHIPTMMVQPYIENAIRHGLLHKRGERKLVVSFIEGEKDSIICIVEDNGIGRKKGLALSEKQRKNHKSFAEKATQERLSLFNDGAIKKIGVEIVDLYEDDTPIGTKVVLNIPIIS